MNIEITRQRAQEFGITSQREGESDASFRDRLSGKLRDMGHIIEAHEAYNGCLYDDPDGDAMTGILGAVAQAMQGKDYGVSGSNQVGVDIAAGNVVQHEKKENPMIALLAAMLTGR